MFDLILKNGRCLLAHPHKENEVLEENLDIAVQDGKIKKIGSLNSVPAKKTLSLSGLYILPGLIDTQVHFREPGLEHKETIYHGSLSAIKGGITAFFEMPNTSPPTAQLKDIEDKVKRAEKSSWCDFAFYLGAVDSNKNQLKDIEGAPACPGVKLFLGHSTGNLVLEDEESLNIVFKDRKRITAVHSEDETRLRERKSFAYKKPLHPRNHPLWRDEETCLLSTKRVIGLANKYKAPVHILHVTTAQEIDFLSHHKNIVSVEVTPQHLTLFAPDCYEKYGAYVQMNPAIREKQHLEALWKGIENGVVDMLGSDHAPHTREEKEKTYPESPSGMPGTQTMLVLMLNHINQGRLDLKRLVQLLAHNPSKRFGLKNQGQIKVDYKANFTVIDLKAKRRIENKWLASRCGWSPFEDWKLQGWPVFTILNGEIVMAEDEVIGEPKGQAIEFKEIG